MKLINLLLFFAPALTLFGGAVALALNNIGGWGWFLLVGLFVVPTSIKDIQKP